MNITMESNVNFIGEKVKGINEEGLIMPVFQQLTKRIAGRCEDNFF